MDGSKASLLGKETEPKSGFHLIESTGWAERYFGSPSRAPAEIGLAVLEPSGHSQLIADKWGIILKKKKFKEELFADLLHDAKPSRLGESSGDE